MTAVYALAAGRASCGIISTHGHLSTPTTPRRLLGYPALALTDHDGLYGSMEFAHAAREAKVQPLTGVELTLKVCLLGKEGRLGLRPGNLAGAGGEEPIMRVRWPTG